jgi:hypothetical protein
MGNRQQSQPQVVRISTSTGFVPNGEKVADRSWWLPMVTNITNFYQWWLMFNPWWPMFTRCWPDGSQGTQCCQPSKSCKNWWKNQKNRTNMSWQYCFGLKVPMNFPIPWLTSVISDTIGSISYHQLSIGKHRWHRWGTRCIFGHQQQCQHRLPDDIGNWQRSQNWVVWSSAAISHRVSQAYVWEYWCWNIHICQLLTETGGTFD